ncbi:MAG: DUF378 domain-containing protein [Candidatus Latescibacterota bacterium]|nr:MAG: DUF378 domain-containing protein [Candidatus Latescibacterota bacterium]
MKSIDVVAAVLLVVGGLNWGLVGFFNFDLVATLFGDGSALSRIVYALVGLCAVYQGLTWKSIQRRWHLAPQAS